MINVQVMRVQRYDQCGELDSGSDVKPGKWMKTVLKSRLWSNSIQHIVYSENINKLNLMLLLKYLKNQSLNENIVRKLLNSAFYWNNHWTV